MSLVFHSSKLTVSAEQFRSHFCLHCSMPSEQWMTESEIRERRRRNSKRDTPTVWFQECLIRCMITEPNRYIGQCRTSYNHVTYNSNFLCITSMRSTPGPWKYIVRYGTWHNIGYVIGVPLYLHTFQPTKPRFGRESAPGCPLRSRPRSS